MVGVYQVHKSFGTVQAVRGISFELQPGQIAGLLGPNGAGKSTTIRMIAGYLLPDAGKVLVAGFDTASHPVIARQSLGYLPEHTPLYTEMRVGEYLLYRAKLYRVPADVRKRSVDWAATRCWLGDVLKRRIGVLSKGYRQRVGLAAALLHNPKVLILDEPTNGLDPSQIRETRQLVRELATDRTMLICSHILPEVERLCHRVLIIAGGQLRADGSPAELTRAGGSRYFLQAREARVGDAERITKLWATLPFVAEVSSKPAGDKPTQSVGWLEWTILARPGSPDLREQIAAAAQQQGILLRELRAQAPTLEGVFMDIMEKSGEPVKDSDQAPPHTTPPKEAHP